MNLKPPNPNLFQRGLIRFGSTPPGRWLFSQTLHHIDRVTYRLTAGSRSATQLFADLPMITLTAVGAKSGQPRTVPLIAVPDGASILLVASNWGRPPLPGWYYNVKANPQVTVANNGRSGAFAARELAGDEWEGAWETAVGAFPGYAAYARRLEGVRSIPLIRLELAEESSQ